MSSTGFARGVPRNAAFKQQRAFTLVETLAASLSFLLILGAIMAVYQLAMTTEVSTGVRTSLQDGLQAGMMNLEKEIPNATGAVVPDQCSSMSLSLWEPVTDATGDLTGAYDEVRFSASGSDLLESVVPGLGSTRSAIADKILLGNLPVPYPSPGLFSYFTRAGGVMQESVPDQATVVRTALVETGKYGEKATSVQLSEDIRMGNR